ncbi:hypothetical protein BDW42DRAFT_158740 [Aspergillus taichungensis]|uniref:Uncharacterized protein n=1 Tax=Aspergillus taichungensis TaxID=482145 RepID=A0A2J5I935_9EURO|nr:hypothetical protein BDW42DRAFT_158740 [Aspergillus taichungensis]
MNPRFMIAPLHIQATLVALIGLPCIVFVGMRTWARKLRCNQLIPVQSAINGTSGSLQISRHGISYVKIMQTPS